MATFNEKDNFRRQIGCLGVMRHIIVIGKNGQLARALRQSAQAHGVSVTAFGRDDCDLSGPPETIRMFFKHLPHCDGVIIAAAYTAVDDAETDSETAFKVNARGPDIIAQECRRRNIPLLYISTDYVFSGEAKAPIKIDHPARPINFYGVSKLEGEKAVFESGARAVILRTSWVFDGTGKNFMTTMLRLGVKGAHLKIVDDQIGRPTYAAHLARACWVSLKKLISEPNFKGGIFHVSGKGAPISWMEFAREIFKQRPDSTGGIQISRVMTRDYPTPAKRPLYSVLDVQDFERIFDHKLPNWKEGLAAAFRERGGEREPL